MSIAVAILEGIFGIGTAIVSGKMQSDILKEGQKEAKGLSLEELAESRRIFNRNLKETQRQFDLSYGLKQEELGMAKEAMAKETFRNQVSRLTGILDKNESLENLYINRFKGLRVRG